MTFHVAVMTPPRSGPWTDDDPMAEVLRALGFFPVPSERIQGNFSFWVKQHYELHEIWPSTIEDAYIQPMNERIGRAVTLVVVDEGGESFIVEPSVH